MPRGVPNTPRDQILSPVIVSNTLDTQDMEIGQHAPRTLKSTGPAADALSESIIEPVDPVVLAANAEKMAMLAFMAEPVTVRIATSTDPNAEQIFELNINGRNELFRRGETKVVPRYFIDRLARLKVTGFTQREAMNKEGIKDILYDSHSGLKYDFAVVRDDHPRGAEWLRHALAEAS